MRRAGRPRLATVFVIAVANVATLATAVVALPVTEEHTNKSGVSERRIEYRSSSTAGDISQVAADFRRNKIENRQEGW
jgi:hypothetical protein